MTLRNQNSRRYTVSLLDLFNQKAKVQPPQKRGDADEQLDVYSGMRVEVTTDA